MLKKVFIIQCENCNKELIEEFEFSRIAGSLIAITNAEEKGWFISEPSTENPEYESWCPDCHKEGEPICK